MGFLFRFLLVVAAAVTSSSTASANGGKFKKGDEVSVAANKVGPFANPTETYRYHSLGFCAPEQIEHHSHKLGESLSGDRKVTSLYDIEFKVPQTNTKLCTKTLTPTDVLGFLKAVEEEYYFELFVDGMPAWGYVGDYDSEVDLVLNQGNLAPNLHKFIYTHIIFHITFNEDRIVGVKITGDHDKMLDITGTPGMEPEPIEGVSFTYSVKWEQDTSIAFEDRMHRYQAMHFLQSSSEIQWLSIINSFVLVILLTALLAIILMRILKNDFAKYLDPDEEQEVYGEEDQGWKLLHGDVFRFPNRKLIFAALLGTGIQLFVMAVLLILLAAASVFSPSHRGSMAVGAIILYSLTSAIGGYVSANMYANIGGRNWVWNTALSAIMFPGPLLIVFFFLNSVAVSHSSTAALPFKTIAIIFLIYVLVTFPLNVVGGIMGKNGAKGFDAPCRTTKVPRQIPSSAWYNSGPMSMLVGGFLPFSAIYVELHYIFSSIWGHRIYTLFGILFLAFLMLLTVASFVTVTLIYFKLQREDHRWWWSSFFYGGSCGFFFYLYTFYYYYQRSDMSGMLQTSFYFGYMALVSYALFAMMGSIGFFSSLVFVKKIYRSIKVD